MTDADTLDHYLVMTGPTRPAQSSCGGTRPWQRQAVAAPGRGSARPWQRQAVYLFDPHLLAAEQRRRSVKITTGSSIPNRLWTDAEIHPQHRNPLLPADQTARLQ